MRHLGAEQVAQQAFDLGLLTQRQLQDVWATLGSRNVPLSDLLQLLVRREYMTSYQVDRVIQGERDGFFFGPYKVLYLVGAGTFARVFRAVHRETGEVVAIKALRSRFSENMKHFGQFIREGRLGIALRHRNIVPIYDAFSEGNTHFLVMEFVEGWSLRDFVKIRKKVEPLQATRLMIGMTEGLRYAFEHGLTHRDLKMSNVMVSSSGEARLVDFGLAAVDESLSEDLLADLPNSRTVDYAALEQATGVRKDDTRSDIYFLGCIYYHMLVGEPPLTETQDRLQRLSKFRFLEVLPIQRCDPTIPKCVTSIVHKAMALDPTQRYQSPSAVLTDLYTAETQLIQEASAGGSRITTGRSKTQAAGTAAAQQPATPQPPPKTLPAQNQRSVMVVEANQQNQDMLRESLKRVGYRVLLTSDPERAFSRLRHDATTADCILFSAMEIGEAALETFNTMGKDSRTLFIPAILLLDTIQQDWKSRALVAEHRVVLSMPITIKQLRTVLATLLGIPSEN